MQKLIVAGLLLIMFATLNSKAFAASLDCTYKDQTIQLAGIQNLEIPENDDAIVINNEKTVPLEHSRIKCGTFGKQSRFDGRINSKVQIILKSCTDEAVLEGHLIDTVSEKFAAIVCNEKKI